MLRRQPGVAVGSSGGGSTARAATARAATARAACGAPAADAPSSPRAAQRDLSVAAAPDAAAPPDGAAAAHAARELTLYDAGISQICEIPSLARMGALHTLNLHCNRIRELGDRTPPPLPPPTPPLPPLTLPLPPPPPHPTPQGITSCLSAP